MPESIAVLTAPTPTASGFRRRPRRRPWAVLTVAVLVCAALARLAVQGAPAMPHALQDGITLAISVFLESFPFVVLGVLLSIAVQIWMPEHWIERALPRIPWARRLALSVLGVFLPVCQCGNVPLARGLVERGLTPSDSITFLLAAPILNPVTIITTYQAFGWHEGILLARIVGGFVIANLIGTVFSMHPEQDALLTPAFAASCAVHAGENGHRWGRSVGRFAQEMSTLMPALIVGSAIAGGIQVGVPRELLAALGSDPLWSVLALMALAFVLSMCSNVDAFFMLAFGSTFLPGAIAAFLTFGAMVDVKMVSLMRTTYRAMTIVQIVALAAVAVLLLGFAVNFLG
ncbi:permease [Gryllotalpicola reticulitermitis]|uniref:Permease n=1 Tax=Gryllotalpicola reticulitermitis TaxID=1184153 RepID=A0ABV8Q547_9MICO